MENSKNNWLIQLNHEDIWSKHMEYIPSMIWHSYLQLQKLAEDGQVYGVMLQCKDLYESLYRIPLIMTLIICESNPAYKDLQGYSDIIRDALANPMAMGKWDTLAKTVIKKNKHLQLPDTLIHILKQTKELYSLDITPVKDSNVVNWRNRSIGHGALKFEDDQDYQIEIRNLLVHLKDYFDDEKDGIRNLYKAAYFFSGDQKLTEGRIFKPEYSGAVKLYVEGKEYEIANFIDDDELRLFLFESYYFRRHQIKYSSYLDGRDRMTSCKYFNDLYEKYVLRGIEDFSVGSGKITREQAAILELLSSPTEYIEPVELTKQLQNKMDKLEHGIISIFMERGTGKSAFGNQMNGLYHSRSLIKDSFSRCYHVQNAAIRGISDFINALNFSFKHSRDAGQDIYSNTDELPSLSLNEDQPNRAMASFLNYYHKLNGKEYTILLIDGIDEITVNTKAILDFIPGTELLDEGVFIILLSRFKNENTVIGSSRKFIEKAEEMSDEIIEVRRDNEINIAVLTKCVERWKKEKAGRKSIDTKELVNKADKRFLYLKAFLEVPEDALLDKTDENRFIKSYLDYVLSFYGQIQKNKFSEIAVTIALFPAITLKQYQEYMNCPELTYEFIGMLNDLLPLLTVNHINGEDAYEFADQAYTEYVLNTFNNTISSVINFFGHSFNRDLQPRFEDSWEIYGLDHNHIQDLGEAFAFYSKGLIEIQHKALKNKTLASHYFSQAAFWFYVVYLAGDVWSFHGYGSYLLKELISSIYSSFLFSLQHPDYEPAQKWVAALINGTLYQQSPPGGYRIFIESLQNSKENNQLARYIISNSRTIEDLRLWFWVLEEQESTAGAECIIQSNQVDRFLEFIDAIQYPCFSLCKALVSTDLPKAQTERILNHLLNNYLARYCYDPSKTAKKNLLDVLEKFKEKKASINPATAYEGCEPIDNPNALAHVQPETLIERIKKDTLLTFLLKHKIDKAINNLLDFDSPIESFDTNPHFLDTLYTTSDSDDAPFDISSDNNPLENRPSDDSFASPPESEQCSIDEFLNMVGISNEENDEVSFPDDTKYNIVETDDIPFYLNPIENNHYHRDGRVTIFSSICPSFRCEETFNDSSVS